MNNNLLIVLAFFAGAALTWWIEGIRWDADVSKLNGAHTAELKRQSDQAVIDLTNQKKRTEAAQIALAALDAKHTKEMADEQTKNEKLRADVAAGTRRVRIAAANLATCKLIGNGTSGTSSLGDAVQIDLTPAGGQTVLDLRASIIKDNEVIEYLQGYIEYLAKQSTP
ncbi:lysis protein (plasmid) [Rahnella aceris]|jgi:prophage endopeptidase|uniref:Lysis protein n=1 Tax=Rahnella sp. (strain Y9602) TaxID=2703885 RepID=A0A0H3FGC1_RAHSY|nr:lysis protein [Rahnella aceris]ADW76109.1 lysis protein [Rahnella aceris]MBU9866193.1 lysis protein [Rahnella aceris]NIA89957.1 lysis protein [Rahnella aceris]